MQKIRYSQGVRAAITVWDFAVLLLVVWLFNRPLSAWSEKDLITCAVLCFLWYLISARTQIYGIPRMLTFTVFLERLVRQLLLFFAGGFLVSYLSRDNFLVFSRDFVLLFSGIFLFTKCILFLLIKWARRRGYNHRNVMFLEERGASKLLKAIIQKRSDYGFKIFPFNEKISIENLKNFWKKNGIHSIFLPFHSEMSHPSLHEIVLFAEKEGVKVNFVPDILSEEFATYELTYAKTQPLLQRGHFPLEYRGNALLKRFLDIIISIIFLVAIASWLFPILAILIKKNSPGTIFFKQKRYGYRDRIFNCYKFRTMVPNSLSEISTTEKNDHRITSFGKFLRKSSLDELPQFWNVLLGDMSLVGPRPHMVSVDDHYREFINHYSVRNTVKPGITGLAQIEGLRGDRGDMTVEMQKRILADAFYVKNWSLSMDFIICIKTFIILLRGDKNAF